MSSAGKPRPLRVAFVHPDLGIGGAERLVVDAALGLVKRGHKVDIYTSHHDPSHCFEETRDGTLNVRAIHPPLPRSIAGKFHIVFAHLRQLHLTLHLLFSPKSPKYDVYFVDQLSTCVPFLRVLGDTRVVFYCHFPDKLLASGEFQGLQASKGRITPKMSLLKRVYRLPMDLWEEMTTGQADLILANSKFTMRVFGEYFPRIAKPPMVIYPGINLDVYEKKVDWKNKDVADITSTRPTLLSMNRFEKKKNVALAVESFALARQQLSNHSEYRNLRLVLAGGYDPRLEDNVITLSSIVNLIKSHKLTYHLITPSSDDTSSLKLPPLNTTPVNPDVLIILNFLTSQRTALMTSPSTKLLLYTPANEHFGIGPVEAMACGLPVLACDSGGPLESVVDDDFEVDEEDVDSNSSTAPAGASTATSAGETENKKRKRKGQGASASTTSSATTSKRTGWLRTPEPSVWSSTIVEILNITPNERKLISARSKSRAKTLFGMDAMSGAMDGALRDVIKYGKPNLRIVLWVFLFIFCGFWCAYAAGEYIVWKMEREYQAKKAAGLVN